MKNVTRCTRSRNRELPVSRERNHRNINSLCVDVWGAKCVTMIAESVTKAQPTDAYENVNEKKMKIEK